MDRIYDRFLGFVRSLLVRIPILLVILIWLAAFKRYLAVPLGASRSATTSEPFD